jgi:hypothetical protein
MKIFKRIVITLIVLIAIFAGIVATRPAAFRISRSISISAPADIAFAQVNDFHKWEAWSPWVKMDPNAKTTYQGNPSGVGSIFTWDGNMDVGTGQMTLTESHPSDIIRIRLDFKKPFEGTSTSEFTFKQEGDQTAVTWSMFGENNFIAKAMGLFMDCDKMVGGEFEKGLADMKKVAEQEAKK